MSSWFDPETGVFRLDEIVYERVSFKKIMEDGIVTGEELAAQSNRVVALLYQVEACLNDENRAMVENLLVELAVLYASANQYNLQQASGR